jgi:phosphoribosylformylglycinamidine synthase I
MTDSCSSTSNTLSTDYTKPNFPLRVGVLVFPGTNCDRDVIHVYRDILGCEVISLWHQDTSLKDSNVIVIPGGFSYGDYLRSGAIARMSPVMQRVKEFAEGGGPVLGICNGFQILCEAGLLPGALLENVTTRFISRFVNIRIEQSSTPFTRIVREGTVIKCPVAHFQGNYFAPPDTLASLKLNSQIVFRYVGSDGEVCENSRTSNPNGSTESIAGICNVQRNVVGLMPHPERAAEPLVGWIGGDSGLQILRSIM